MNPTDYFWQATVAELKKGYRFAADTAVFECLFCPFRTEQGVVYKESETRYVEAEKAMQKHIGEVHGSPLQALLQLDKRWTGLTELQARLVAQFATGANDQETMDQIGAGSISTVRNHRFALREKTKQAKVCLAIGELMEQQGEQRGKPIASSAFDAERLETQKILNTYFPQGVDGALSTFPTREKRRLILLRQIATRFAPGQTYTEKEVNAILSAVYTDHVLLRRLLIDYGFLTRRPDGSEYRRADVEPTEPGAEPGKEEFEMDRKKELTRQYKDSPRPTGVFQIKNKVNGKLFLLKAMDIPGIINRHQLELVRGIHRNHELQADWNAFGADSFSFDVLATLKPEDHLPENRPAVLVKLLEEWLEKLQPFDDKGYNKPVK